MKDPTPISRVPLSPETLNYADLLRDGIAEAQFVSGELWTDYNEHDPGVTILQALCFALTDLAYRTEHPIEDILASSGSALGVSTDSQGLFTGNKIFGCAPFTANDYRKLIYDEIVGVKNAWLEPIKTDAAGVSGLYRVLIQTFPSIPPIRDLPETSPPGNEEIVANVWKLLQPLRTVGEDFASVALVRQRELALDAEIEIDPDSNPEDLVAGLLFRVDMALNPPPEIEDVDTALQRGVPPDQIFDGPALFLGAIDDASLKPLRTDAPFEQVMETVLSVDGVLAVNRLRIRPTGDDTEPIKKDEMVVPTFSRNEAAIAGIRVFRDGVQLDVDLRRVISSLAHREQQRRWDVNYAVKRMEDVAYGRVPLGNARRFLSRYRSIQHLFPGVYGIGRYGADEGANPLIAGPDISRHARLQRQVEARQLKAYLLFFEQLLADYLAQLEHTAQLFSCEKLDRTYACQTLVQPGDPGDDDAPDIALALGGPDDKERRALARASNASDEWFDRYKEGLEAITAAHDPVVDRRERALNHILARFNERFDDARLQQLRGSPPDHLDAFLEWRTELKRLFLSDYVRLSKDRSLGVDVTDPKETALQRRVRLLSGFAAPIRLVEHILLRDAKGPAGIGDLTVDTDFRIRSPEPARAITIGDADFQVHAVIDREDGVEGWLDFVRRLVDQGADPTHFVIYPPSAYRVSLRLEGVGGLPGIEFLQLFAAAGEAEIAIGKLVALFKAVRDGARPCHDLIRPTVLPRDFFSHRVSVFLPVEATEDEGKIGQTYRDFVALTLRRNLPAHLALDCFWLDRDDMVSFCKDYEDWQETKRLLHATRAPAQELEIAAANSSGKLRAWIHRRYCRQVLRERAELRGGATSDAQARAVGQE